MTSLLREGMPSSMQLLDCVANRLHMLPLTRILRLTALHCEPVFV